MLVHWRKQDGSWIWILDRSYDPNKERDLTIGGSVLKERKALELIVRGERPVIAICGYNKCVRRCKYCMFHADELALRQAMEFIENFDPKRWRGRYNRGPAGAVNLFDAWEVIVKINAKRGKPWGIFDTALALSVAWDILWHWPESGEAKYWREQLAPFNLTFGECLTVIENLTDQIEEDAA
jgi:hypothetical protein